MVRETLLRDVPIPADNVHRIRGEIPPELAADEYETVLREFFERSAGCRASIWFSWAWEKTGIRRHCFPAHPHSRSPSASSLRLTSHSSMRVA